MRALSFLLPFLLLLPAAPARAEQLSPIGGAAAALSPSGARVLVVWIQRGPDGVGIVARPVDATGRARGPARLVATTRPGWAMTAPPAVVWDPQRREHLVAFQATTAAEVAGDVEIFTRRVAPDGRPRGEMRRVTRTGDRRSALQRSEKPSLARDPRTGATLLAFTATVSDDGSRELRVQRLSPDGERIGLPRRVGPAPPASAGGTSGVAGVLPGHGFVAMLDTFGHADGAPAKGGTFLQRLTDRAEPRGALRRLSPSTAQQTAVALVRHPRSGRTLAVWRRDMWSGGGFAVRLLGPDGRPLDAAREVAFSRSWDGASFTPHGSGWAVLIDRYVPGGDTDIFLGRLTAGGALAGTPERLTTFAREINTSNGPDDDRFVHAPLIASDDRGRLLGMWTEEPEGGPGTEIHMRGLG